MSTVNQKHILIFLDQNAGVSSALTPTTAISNYYNTWYVSVYRREFTSISQSSTTTNYTNSKLLTNLWIKSDQTNAQSIIFTMANAYGCKYTAYFSRPGLDRVLSAQTAYISSGSPSAFYLNIPRIASRNAIPSYGQKRIFSIRNLWGSADRESIFTSNNYMNTPDDKFGMKGHCKVVNDGMIMSSSNSQFIWKNSQGLSGDENHALTWNDALLSRICPKVHEESGVNYLMPYAPSEHIGWWLDEPVSSLKFSGESGYTMFLYSEYPYLSASHIKLSMPIYPLGANASSATFQEVYFAIYADNKIVAYRKWVMSGMTAMSTIRPLYNTPIPILSEYVTSTASSVKAVGFYRGKKQSNGTSGSPNREPWGVWMPCAFNNTSNAQFKASGYTGTTKVLTNTSAYFGNSVASAVTIEIEIPQLNCLLGEMNVFIEFRNFDAMVYSGHSLYDLDHFRKETYYYSGAYVGSKTITYKAYRSGSTAFSPEFRVRSDRWAREVELTGATISNGIIRYTISSSSTVPDVIFTKHIYITPYEASISGVRFYALRGISEILLMENTNTQKKFFSLDISPDFYGAQLKGEYYADGTWSSMIPANPPVYCDYNTAEFTVVAPGI